MTKNRIIENLFTGKNFNDCIGRMDPEHLRDDLKMEVIGIVCEWPEEKIKGLHERKELEFYVVRVILNQMQSNSSPFFKKYRRFMEPFVEDPGPLIPGKGNNTKRRHETTISEEVHRVSAIVDEDIEERAIREQIEDIAIEEINGLYWYDQELIKLYMKHGNYRAIQKETGIPFASCYKNIQKSLKILRGRAAIVENKPIFSKAETLMIQNNSI